MAAPRGPLAPLRLPSGPSLVTAEQRYWKSFKKPLLVPSTGNYAVTDISAMGDGFAVTTGMRVQIYSNRTRKLLKSITRFDGVARSADVRADSRVVVAGDDSGKMQVFDVRSRAILRGWTQHQQPVWCTRWAPGHGTTVLSASDDATVRLWDLAGDAPTHTFAGHDDYVRSAAFMPGTMAPMVVSGSYDSTVKLWDPRQGHGSAAMTFKHAAPVESVLALASGTTLLAAAANTVSVLDVVAARPLHHMCNHQKTVTSLSLASRGSRLVTGGLDGHVKVFETTGWNVVSSSKYQSPVLCVAVIAAPDADAPDRHLAVGMQSGILSIRTRLSHAQAVRDRDRDKEMAALLAGSIAAHDSKRLKRKRRLEAAARLDLAGEDAQVVIAHAPPPSKRELDWHRDLRHGHYARALDRVLDPASPHHSAVNTLNLLLALRHRTAVRDALEGRDEARLLPVMRFVSHYVGRPHFVSVCVEVAMHLVDLYAHYMAASAELRNQFRHMSRRVRTEEETAQKAHVTAGMVESLLFGAMQ
ncbi:hypothetical protein CDD82_3890 [Ophiocordyceps australis]|uniref:U3 small nucleolar RNA-associated protein 15 C-terminal domain-containing protein n=1 Tax=Ophiocordyceps australis TaxID=1399860 RepID=A0A2C5Z9X0_9HYPO|nr:hypothetical protein CDD82_3890 [Ophiocordyceps australis]